jgi:hypothetical protein
MSVEPAEIHDVLHAPVRWLRGTPLRNSVQAEAHSSGRFFAVRLISPTSLSTSVVGTGGRGVP